MNNLKYMNEDFVKSEIVNDLNYLFNKINWSKSFLDVKAIAIMNNISGRIKSLKLDPNIYNNN